MATLESQYKGYMIENPTSTYSYDEWLKNVFYPRFNNIKFTDEEIEELKEWDVTLMDGLEDLPWDETP